MGYELRRLLREALGPQITGLQRAVALEIADDANDATRKSIAELDDLARWTGAKDTNVVRNALKRLSAAGWEFRVPIGKGKDGRTMYAVPGVRMTFLVPPFEGVAVAIPSQPKEERGLPLEGAGATPSKGQGVAGAPSEGAGAPSEGAGATPYSSIPSTSSREQAGEAAPSDADDIPAAARPLVDALTAADVIIRWPFQGNQWFPVLAVIAKSGVPAMVQYAIKVSSRTQIESAKYLLPGWKELPPIPSPDAERPPLRAVAGGTGWQPYTNPTDHSAYKKGWNR